jgi:chemotaxis protein MotB
MAEPEQRSKGKPGRGSGTLWILLIGLIFAGVAAWYLTIRRSEFPARANSLSAVQSTLHLETFVLNVGGTEPRAYLRVGIDLGLNQPAKHAEETVPVAQVRDTILAVMADAQADELVTTAGKRKLKQDLLHALQEQSPQLGVQEVYASAQVDQRKVGKLAMAIQVAFQELGVFSASTTKVPMAIDEPMPFSTVQAIENAKRTTELGRISSPPLDTITAASDEANLSILEAELQQALQKEIAMHSVSVHRESEGLVISLREFGFFDSGSATLRPAAVPAIDRIASILAIRTCRIRIEGHTDDIPIHTPQMASNWELSTARATELVRLLIVRYNFSPDRLAAAGYAEYHPIASNASAQGRAQNRRVDLVILAGHLERKDALADNSRSKPSAAAVSSALPR